MKKIIAIILGLNLLFAFAGSASAATVSGTKFNDLNGNGVQDLGEVGIPGVIIYLDQNANATLDGGDMSVITGLDGSFTFPNVADGTYAVREQAQAGWTQTFPGTTANMQHNITVTGGTNVGAINFANQLSVAVNPAIGTITGTKFNDLDGDSVRDAGEPGLAGVTMFLDANANGTLDGGEVSTTTDGSGNFSFGGLAAGNFTVREVAQAGWTQTFPGATAGLQHSVTLGAGANLTGINFANQFTATAAGVISGVKFNDLDADGVRDAGEPGIAGINIFLDVDGDAMWDPSEAVVTTDANGEYRFVGLAAGNYTVREQGQAGWTQTLPTLGSSFRHSVNLALGASIGGLDFGNYRLGTLDDPNVIIDDGDADPDVGGSVAGPGNVLGDAVGGDSLPVTGIALSTLLAMLLAFAALGYKSVFVKKAVAKAKK